MTGEMLQGVEISRAAEGDRHEIRRVHRAAVIILCVDHYTREQIDAWIKTRRTEDYLRTIRNEIVLVARVGSRVVGFAEMTRKGIVNDALYVHPSHVRTGIGSRLLACVEHEASVLGSEVVNADVTMNADPFYLNRGYSFQGEGTRTLRAGVILPCVHMQKRI